MGKPAQTLFKKNKWQQYLAMVTLACTAASAASAAVTSEAAEKKDNGIKILSLNTWNDRFAKNPSVLADFLKQGDYDVLTFQELRTSHPYLEILPGVMAEQGMGDYVAYSEPPSDVGVISRLPGSFGFVQPKTGVAYTVADATASRPKTLIGTVHLDYRDPSAKRVEQAQSLVAWAQTQKQPVILTGDFNAGDVSERGLHSVSQQELLLREYTKNTSNAFWKQLLDEYAQDPALLAQYIQDNAGKQPNKQGKVPEGLFTEELYPIASNTPQTLNVLKKQYQVLRHPSEREGFKPHELEDGSVTWPSAGEDKTNTWASWHRNQIDHFMVSRPYGKWFALDDDPNNPYLGVIEGVDVVHNADGSKTPISDHVPLAHNVVWQGPIIEEFKQGEEDKLRVVWNQNAATFSEDNKVFELSRNNMRDDLFLGQIADANGNPLLDWLSEDEKKQRFSCDSTDARLSSAIAEYCIDDHSFIAETLVSDGGTIAIKEDAALGGELAKLRLNNGGLRIDGTDMKVLNRELVLEGQSASTLSITEAGHTVVTGKTISGSGGLMKQGAGILAIQGEHTYQGATDVQAGQLALMGTLASSVTVQKDATLSGTGKVAGLAIKDGGHLAIGQSIGQLDVAGDVVFEPGAQYHVEVNHQGQSDALISTGKADLQGGTVWVSLENSQNLLTKADAESLLGSTFNIVQATGGVNGQFDVVAPNYLFVGTKLDYQQDKVALSVGRNATEFASAARTDNQRAVAQAVEGLAAGHGVYESILGMSDAGQATQAFDQLGGQIHADMAAALLQESRQLRDGLNSRLRLAGDELVSATGPSVWAQAFGGWGNASGDKGVYGYDTHSQGVLFGVDADVAQDWRVGAAAGYSHSSLDADNGADGDSDNVHAALYAGKSWGNTSLRTGVAQSWHRLETKRTVHYGAQFDRLEAKYNGQTQQAFAELSHALPLAHQWQIEPFANLAYSRFSQNDFSEQGGAAALQGEKEAVHSTQSTVGVRGSKRMALGNDSQLTLRTELGWMHEFSDEARSAKLGFKGTEGYFSSHSVGAAKNAAVVKAEAEMAVNKQAVLSLGYAGTLASDHKAHSINAKLNWRF